MAAKIEYKASVKRDLRKLDRATALRTVRKIEQALGSEASPSAALSGEFVGLYCLRVGDYRVIYARASEGYLILRIGHRRDVYQRGRP